MGNQNAKRALSFVVSMLMVISSINFSLVANAAESDAARIIGFDALEESVATQSLPIGADISQVTLPNSLKATVETVEEVEVQKAVEKAIDEAEPEKAQESKICNEDSQTEADAQVEEATEAETPADGEAGVDAVAEDDDSAEPVSEDVEEPVAEEKAEEETPAEEPVDEAAPAEDTGDASESVDISFIDILFPAIVAQAEESQDESAVAGASATVPELTGDATEVTYETVVERQVVHKSVTIENVEWIVADGQSFDSSVEAAYVFTPVIKADYVVAATLPTIKVNIVNTNSKTAFEKSQVVDGVRVTVKADKGVFPEGATLSVSKVSLDEEQAVEAAVDEERADNKNVVESYTFDIKVLDKDGNEIEPDNSKGTVKVSFTLEEVANVNLDTDVYHVKGEVGDLTAEELEAEEVGADTVEAATDGFSYYTVEFTYNNLQYSMNGDNTVALTDVLTSVGLSGNIEAVESSDTELFTVEQNDGVWTVTAIKAFSSNETLTVTLDGVEYVIEVTDDEYVAQVINGETVNAYASFTDAVNAWLSGNDNKTLKLMMDVTITAPIVNDPENWPKCCIYIGNSKTLDLNGYGIKYTGEYADEKLCVFKIDGYQQKFTITDSNPNVEHKYTITEKSNGAGLAIVNENLEEGYKTFNGGYITGGNRGAIFLYRGSFEMTGGTIIGNSSNDYSGGLYCCDSNCMDVTIDNANFIGNTCGGDEYYSAGAILYSKNSKGNLTIRNTTIQYNYNEKVQKSARCPGGIFIHMNEENQNDKKKAYLDNVTIMDNVGGDVGGVCWYRGEIILSGKCVIEDNKKTDGSISNLSYDNGIAYGPLLTSDGEVSAKSHIGISMYTYNKEHYIIDYYFTKDSDLRSKKSIFTSDNSSYTIIDNGTGLKLSDQPVTIDYANENATAISDSFELATTNTATTGASSINISSVIEGENPTIYYRTTGSTPGEWVALQLTVRPAAPTKEFATIKASSSTEADGAIDYTDTDMEYKLSTAESYSDCSANRTTVAAGTYLIRYKATSSAFASKTVSVTVGEKDPQNPPTDDMFTVTHLSVDGNTGGDIDISGSYENLQYSSDGGENWIDVASELITGLSKGSYLFRYKGTNELSPSPTITLHVKQYVDQIALDSNTPVEIYKGQEELSEAPVIGDILSVACQASGLTYQWYRGNNPISGATGAEYTVSADDAGKNIHVVVSQAKDEFGDTYSDGPRTKSSDSTEAVEKKAAQPPSDLTDLLSIIYDEELIILGDSNTYEAAYADKVPIDGSYIDLTLALDAESESERTIYVRTKETSDTYASVWVSLTLPARPVAPTSLTSADAKTAISADGKIIGTTTAMEYRLVNGEDYTDAGAGSTSVKPGTYLVRYKAINSEKTYASKATEIVVSAAKKPNFTIERVQVSEITDNTVTMNGALSPKEFAEDMTFIKQLGFKYKKAGDAEWTTVEGELQGDGTFIAVLSNLTSDSDYTYKVFLYPEDGEYQETKEFTFHSDKESSKKTDAGKITGTVKADDETDDRGYIVSVEKGNDIIASTSYPVLSTDPQEYSFDKLADGLYNVVCRTTDGKFTETQMLEVANGGVTTAKAFVVLNKNVSAVVEVEDDAPKAAVEGLGDILTDDEKDSATGNKDIEVKLEVKNESEEIASQVEAIKEILTPGLKIGQVLELNLWKNTTVWDELGNKDDDKSKSENIGEKNNKVLKIALEVTELVAKGLEVFRYHGKKAEALTSLTQEVTDPSQYRDNTYYFNTLTNILFLYASGFSSYAIAVTDEDYVAPSGESGSSGSIATVPVYRLFSTKTGYHFYTMNVAERDALVAAGWTDEGIAWQTVTKAGKPVYRLFDVNGNGGHFFTADAAVRDQYIAAGWRDEGVAWYAAEYVGRPVYKITNPKVNRVLYTISAAEKDALAATGFTVEEAKFKAY